VWIIFFWIMVIYLLNVEESALGRGPGIAVAKPEKVAARTRIIARVV
jgi:hypothetical protein